MMNQYCNIITMTTPGYPISNHQTFKSICRLAYPDFVSLDISVKNSQNDAPVTEALVSVSIGTEIVADSVAVDGSGFVAVQVFQEIIHQILFLLILFQSFWVLLDNIISNIKTNESLQNGIYTVVIEASGFITSEFEMTVACSSDSDSECVSNPKTAILSPELAPGETRIIMTWETNVPSDLDIHVISVRKSDSSICRTYYGNKDGCEEIRKV